MFRWTIWGLLASCAVPVCAEVTLRQTEVSVRFVDYRFAVKTGDAGVPKLDWDLFRRRPRETVTENWPAIELQNSSLKAVLIPRMARVHSLVSRSTRNEQLWINPCAVPLGANNDTGFWMTWGGMERVLPSREHGTSHALTWQHQVLIDNDDQKTIRCSVVEPMTRIAHDIYFSIYAAKPFLESTIVLSNTTTSPLRFSHWTTAVLSPGGNEISPNTELIVPAERFVPDDRDFNEWMFALPSDVRTSPLRFVRNWTSIGDLLTSRLLQPFYAVYSHEHDEGIVHTFDLDASPTVDIWGWGYPPSAARQKEFTASLPNNGYIEFWNGNAKDFRDDSLKTLGSGETLSWTERTFCVNGILAGGADVRSVVARKVQMHHPAATPLMSEQQATDSFEVELKTIAQGDGTFSWSQSRGVRIPTLPPRLLVTLQQKTNDTSHGYHDIYMLESLDSGESWSAPEAIPNLRRVANSDGYEVVAGDLWLTYHPPTKRVLATGKTFNFRDGRSEDYRREAVAYAVFDPATDQWSPVKTVAMPKTDKSGAAIIAANTGCNQPVVLAHGNVFLPVRYQRRADWRNYVTTVVECTFDGAELRYSRHGSELDHPIGRGLYEPSLTEFKGEYFLTMRADEDAFVAKGNDDLIFGDVHPWRFDDGASVGSYNTQQHWLRRSNALYLIYTRVTDNNAHIFRHRAPLYIAQVDPVSTRVIRSTERTLVPENGWTLGNFGVFDVNENETMVITSEGLPADRQSWANNRVIIARILWR